MNCSCMRLICPSACMKANQGVDISTTYLYRVGHMCWLVLEHVPACAWACASLCLGMCWLRSQKISFLLSERLWENSSTCILKVWDSHKTQLYCSQIGLRFIDLLVWQHVSTPVPWLSHTFNIFSVNTAGMNKLKIQYTFLIYVYFFTLLKTGETIWTWNI